MLRILKIARNKKFKCNAFSINSTEFQEALECWIIFYQLEFRNNWEKRFKRLGPVMGSDNIITVGGRISSWLKKNWDKDMLLLLPSKSPLSKLIVTSTHYSNHDGVDATVAKVRKDYWIPRLPKLAKEIRNSCSKCRILDKQLCGQKIYNNQ